MHLKHWLWLAPLLAVGCGNDGHAEKRRAHLTLRPGQAVEDTIRTNHHYDVILDWSFTEDVDRLPNGMHFETIDIRRLRHQHLAIDYELKVGHGVEPGRYAFQVKYELVGADFFEEVIRLKLVIHVERRGRNLSSAMLRLSEDVPEADAEEEPEEGEGRLIVRHIRIRLP
jgi:hypothetical protein